MNEMPVGERQEPPSSRPGRPAVQGELRRLLREVFPDLDPDVVGEVLGLTCTAEPRGDHSDEQGEK